MHIETISTLEEMEPFAAGWNDAVSRSLFDSVFSTYEWFSAWIRHFAGENLRIVVARHGNRFVGALPFLQEKKTLRSLSNLQSYQFNVILPRQGAREMLKRMIDHLTRTLSWDSIQLEFVPDSSDPCPLFREIGYRTFSETYMRSPILNIDGSWGDYWGQLSRNLRRNLDYKERRLERAGCLGLVRVENGDCLEEHVQKAFDIERSGWKGENGTAIACSERDRGFYLELAKRMSARGCLLLYFLEYRGRSIAFSYCLQYKDRINLLKTGYSPEYGRYSPGMILQKRILQDIHQRRQGTVFDFLGARDEWKTKWTGGVQPLRRISVFNNKIAPVLLYNALMARESCKNSIRRYPAAYQLLKRSRQLLNRIGGMHEAEDRPATIPKKESIERQWNS